MTKELNLFLGDTKEVPTTTKNSSEATGEKKSGSLFDNILSNLKEETASSKDVTSTENKTAQNSTSNQAETKNELNTAKDYNAGNKTEVKSDNTASKETKSIKNDEAIENKAVNKDTNKNVHNSLAKNESSTMSLLDRMMLEAGTKTDATKNKESNGSVEKVISEKVPVEKVSAGKVTSDTALEKITPKINEDLQSSPNQKPDDKTLESKTADKSTVISEDKTNINEKDSSKAENSQNKQSEKSLFDSLIKEVVSDTSKDIPRTSTPEETNVATAKENSKESIEQKVVNPNVPKEQILPENETVKANDILPKDTTSNTTDTKTVKQETTKEEVKQPIAEAKTSTTDLKEPKNNTVPASENINTKQVTSEENKEKSIKTEVIQKQEMHKTETVKQDISKETVSVSQKETEIKKFDNGEVQTTKVVEKTVVKNENVANELAKISKSDNETKANISKEEIEKLPTQEKIDKPETKENKEKSLLDKLVDESKQLAKNRNSEEVKVEVAKSADNPLKQNIEKSVDPLVTNMYLSSQKKNLSDASIAKVATGKQMASDATSVKDVEKSAQFLNLGFEESEVTVKMQEFEKNTKLNILDKLAFAKTVIKQDLTNNSAEIVSKQTMATNSAIAGNSAANENETVVQLNVSSANVANIESRIIGARQQMGSMMSDVARNMYLNYKPPVTAFRMNLNPGTLGSIAIVMKSDKDNGLSISLNMSNNATLDSFVDNQSSLRAALAKNFNTETNFTLDFNMQQQNNSDSDSNSQQNEQNRSSHDETAVMQNMSNSENQESTASDYM